MSESVYLTNIGFLNEFALDITRFQDSGSSKVLYIKFWALRKIEFDFNTLTIIHIGTYLSRSVNNND